MEVMVLCVPGLKKDRRFILRTCLISLRTNNSQEEILAKFNLFSAKLLSYNLIQ